MTTGGGDSIKLFRMGMGMVLKEDGDGWLVGGESTFITLMPVDFDTSVKADSSLGYFAVGDMRDI